MYHLINDYDPHKSCKFCHSGHPGGRQLAIDVLPSPRRANAAQQNTQVCSPKALAQAAVADWGGPRAPDAWPSVRRLHGACCRQRAAFAEFGPQDAHDASSQQTHDVQHNQHDADDSHQGKTKIDPSLASKCYRPLL